ncbi:hypothetical protein DXG01_010123 [Tephrocybe rancida]|nr:hypothetical protein DXG01_010123 [Tephrocybe rancida]
MNLWTQGIQLTFGPSSKKPQHIPLVEITSADAASHATDVLLDIALQAQSRKCRLHPDQFASTYVSPTPRTEAIIDTKPTTSSRPVIPIPHRTTPTSVKSTPPLSGSTKDAEITALKAELEKEKQRPSPQTDSKTKLAVVQKQLKGASLANPNKKARKYKAIEFESDEE